jgi:Tat protein translocase TatB subunit
MLNIGPQELLIILIIALIVVGPQRLPSLGRSIGRGLRELRKTQDEVKRTIKGTLDEETSNDGSRRRPAGPPTSTAASKEDGTTPPPPIVTDGAPTASEPPLESEVRDISRSLGKTLSELRRARDEVQRSFRVEVNGPTPKPRRPPSTRETSEAPPGTERGHEGPAPDDAAAE